MTSEARRGRLLEMLSMRTSASMPEMASRFGVSEMTIRRDVELLTESGKVIRIPGGARVARVANFEKTFSERLSRMAEAKDRIGEAAAKLVNNGESVLLDSGTTTLFVARHLRSHRDIVVVTFSLAALDELAGANSIRVELTGGVYRRSSHDLIGPAVAEALDRLSVDKAIFGAAAVSMARGVMVIDPEAPRALARSGRERILVVDSSKMGTEALYFFCKISACHLVITDSGVLPKHLRALRKVVDVQVV